VKNKTICLSVCLCVNGGRQLLHAS